MIDIKYIVSASYQTSNQAHPRSDGFSWPRLQIRIVDVIAKQPYEREWAWFEVTS